ncbi:hypothetical protein [Lacinutrix algicola]|uniref:hypothetical protein n=1 Tax=Lacinutrix algicola TaxID=342954 RepID=UPI000A7F492A|nr:hypothetical protein [Lacinutrix algicola]
MKFYILLLSLCFTYIGFSQTMPSNPKAGECYVRCRDNNSKLLEWKKIDCDLVNEGSLLEIENLSKGVFSEKDRKVIKKKLVKILKKGFTVELLSHYYSNRSDSINQLRSIQNGKALFSYLDTEGINTKQLLISAYGNSKPLENCYSLKCADYYIKNTRIEYRVVNTSTKENVVWNYDNEKKIWCYTAKEN